MEASKDQPSESTTIPTSRKASAFLFTFGFFSIPLGIYSKPDLFHSFCSFHSRKLSLNSKSPHQIIILSLLMSVIYTSIYCPIYYFGLMKILGVEGVHEMAKMSRDSVKETYKKYPAMEKLDARLVYELDKTFGIENTRTEKFLSGNLGEEFLLKNQRKKTQKPKSENTILSE